MKLLSYSLLIVCCLMVFSLNGVNTSSSKTKTQLTAEQLKSLKFIFKNNKLIVTGKNHKLKSIISLKNSLEKLLIKKKVKSLTFSYKQGSVMLSKKTKLTDSKQKKIIEVLESEFSKHTGSLSATSKKSFLDVLTFKDYYEPHYKREKVYYEKGLSTKWIVLIIVLVIVLILICCCILFCLGCFKTCFGHDDD